MRFILILVSAFIAAVASAAEAEDTPTSKLNSVDVGPQINPGIAALPNDRFVLVYEDRADADGSASGIFGGVYDAQNQLIHDCGVMNTSTGSFQTFPHVASAPDGTFMVVWSNFTNTFGQLFSPTCEKLGDETFLGATFNGLDVTADTEGNFWVVRSKDGLAYVRKYNSAGDLLVEDVLLEQYILPEKPVRVVSAVLATGELLVGWYNKDNPDSSDIYGLYVNVDGTVTTEPFLINMTTANNQIEPMMAALSGGGFAAVWASEDANGVSDIVGRVFTADGSAGDEFVVSTANLGNQSTPYVVGRVGGGFTVGWTDESDPQHVYLSSYDVNGLLVGQQRAVSIDESLSLTASDEIEMAELTNGSLAAVWAATAVGNQDIYGRVLAGLAPVALPDLDEDGVPDSLDTDDDGDGVTDDLDAFPRDASESADTDNDGIGNNADTDDDNDGFADQLDEFPLDATEWLDDDSDGTGNNADPDDDNDTVADADDLYPLDNTKHQNTPYVITFEGAVDYVSDSVEGKEPHQIKSGDTYRYTLVLDNHNGEIESQSWARTFTSTDIEYLLLTIEGDASATFLVDLAMMRPIPGFFGSSIGSIQGAAGLVLETDANGMLTKPWNDVTFLGLGDDVRLDWYQTYGWLDSEIAVAMRLQARTNTVAETSGLYSDQSSWAFTGVDQAIRIEDATQWSAVTSASCAGPLTLSSQADVDAVLANVCTRIEGDLIIDGTAIRDLLPLRIVRTIDGQLTITPDMSAPTLNGLQGVTHINGEAVVDSDGDYHPDYMDDYPNDSAAAFDTDGDGLPNDWLPGKFSSSVDPSLTVDNDDDGDGTVDYEDDLPLDASDTVDSDRDGIGNNADFDDDGDGVEDVLDAFPLDVAASVDDDQDGAPDAWNVDATEAQIAVSELSLDAFPGDGSETTDTDGDGTGNNADLDDDNDTYPDTEDDFPLDATEWLDTDGDGIGNNADPNDDNDAIPDENDAFPLDPTEVADRDGDGIGNNSDPDLDGDGVDNELDAFPYTPGEWADTDGDLIGDNADTDDDGDGLLDTEEIELGLDPLNTDSDGDGIKDDVDESHVLISGQFPEFDVSVIRPGVQIESSWFRLISPSECFLVPAADSIEESRAEFSLAFSERTPTGTYFVGDDSPYVGTADGTLYDQSWYPIEIANQNGVVASSNIENWALTRASIGDAPAFTFTATLSNIIDGLPTKSNGGDQRLATFIHLNFDSDTNDYAGFEFYADEATEVAADTYRISMTRLIPEGRVFEELRISRLDTCDGALNLTLFSTDTDGDDAADAFDLFPNDANEFSDIDGDGLGDNGDAFPDDPAASVDTDGDGSPDEWNESATDEQIAASELNLDAFPEDPAASVDTDGDGYPDTWNEAATDEQIEASDLVLDAFPLDETEVADTDSDGIGDNDDIDDALQGVIDPQLAQCISEQNVQRASDIEDLNCGWRNIESLSGLEAFIAITRLELSGNDAITDLDPLSALVNLRALSLESVPLNGSMALTSLPLESLDLARAGIGSLEGILPTGGQLKWLRLMENPIASLSPLSAHPLLETLNIQSTQASMTTFPNNLSNLAALNVVYTEVRAINQIPSYLGSSLRFLAMRSEDPLTPLNLAGISQFSALRTLDMGYSYVDWSSAESEANAVAELQLTSTSLTSLADISNAFAGVERIIADWTGLTSLEGVESLTQLSLLAIRNAQLMDLSALNRPLSELGLSNNQISDISPLGPLYQGASTGRIGLSNNPIRRLADTFQGWQVNHIDLRGTDLSCEEIAYVEGYIYESTEVLWPIACASDPDRDYFYADEDAYPEDPAAAADSDGDGYPDSWNREATAEQIAASELSLDAFPDNPNESVDADQDGVGANTDVDDSDPESDTDNDGLSDSAEREYGSNPLLADTDGDGFTDGEEVAAGTSPTDIDDMPMVDEEDEIRGFPLWLIEVLKARESATAPQ